MSYAAMADPHESTLPALQLRTAPESDWRRLEARAERVEALERRVAELEGEGDAGALVAALLPVLDSFALALQAAALRQDHAAIVEGVELVEREMRRVLARHGLERIPVAAGDAFDLSLHETLEGLDALVAEAPRVVGELRPGYRLLGRILRRALVRIAGPERGA